MEEKKKFKIRKLITHLFAVLVGVLLAVNITTTAANIPAAQVTYTSNSQSTVSGALDELFSRSNNIIMLPGLTSAATNRGIGINADGSIYDSSPTDDGRPWSYENANWQLPLNKGTYRIHIYFTTKATDNAALFNILNSSDIRITGGGLTNIESLNLDFTLESQTDIGIELKVFDGVCKVVLYKVS